MVTALSKRHTSNAVPSRRDWAGPRAPRRPGSSPSAPQPHQSGGRRMEKNNSKYMSTTSTKRAKTSAQRNQKCRACAGSVQTCMISKHEIIHDFPQTQNHRNHRPDRSQTGKLRKGQRAPLAERPAKPSCRPRLSTANSHVILLRPHTSHAPTPEFHFTRPTRSTRPTHPTHPANPGFSVFVHKTDKRAWVSRRKGYLGRRCCVRWQKCGDHEMKRCTHDNDPPPHCTRAGDSTARQSQRNLLECSP
jgi:hypothetical protein